MQFRHLDHQRFVFGSASVLGRRLAGALAGAGVALVVGSADWKATAEWQADRSAKAVGSAREEAMVPPSVQVPALGHPSPAPPTAAPEVTGALEPVVRSRNAALPPPSGRSVKNWRYQ